jgi:hypothetical protein
MMIDSTAGAPTVRPIQLNVCSDGTRIVILKTTMANTLVSRIRSMPLDGFDFAQTREAMDATGDADIILIPDSLDVLERLEPLVTPHYIRAMRDAPVQFQAAFAEHLRREGIHDQRTMIRTGPELPPRIQRVLDRLGEHGYALLGGQSVFANARAWPRLAAATYRAFKQWPERRPLRDDLAKELIGLNLVGQAFQALENFAAMFAALKATSEGDYSRFAKAYLSFGRTESHLRSASVLQTLDELGGNNAHATIARVFNLPLSTALFEKCGLANCGIDDPMLIECARFTRSFMVERFKALARTMLVKEPGTGRPIKTAAARVYGAYKHGFAVAIPYLEPGNTVVGYDAEVFRNDDDFEAYVRASDTLGSLVYLDDDDSITTMAAPVNEEDLKPLLRVVYRCTFWLQQFTSYALSLYGSVDGRFPYLINSVTILGTERRAILQQRLEELEGAE